VTSNNIKEKDKRKGTLCHCSIKIFLRNKLLVTENIATDSEVCYNGLIKSLNAIL
jgi:hypothetical protein